MRSNFEHILEAMLEGAERHVKMYESMGMENNNRDVFSRALGDLIQYRVSLRAALKQLRGDREDGYSNS